MLVIFDKQTRREGVKEYLEKGTKGDRDIKDKRVALVGNLDIVDKVAELGRKKGYKEAYRNIVLSFEETLDIETLENIAKDFIKLYMQPYNEDEYTAYAEAHLPKKKINSRGYERKNHIHIVIPKYSLKLKHQLDLGDHSRRLAEIEKIKEYLEAKYNLKSLERKKILKEDKAEILNIQKYENRNKAKKAIENYIKDNIAHYEKLDNLVSDLEKKLNAEIKKSKRAKTPYISIKLPQFPRAIRLKGELFSDESFKKARESLLKNSKYVEIKTQKKDPQEILRELEELRKARVERILKRIRNKRLQVREEHIKREQRQKVKNYLSYAEKLLNEIYDYQFNLNLPKFFFVKKYENTGYTLISNKKKNIKVLDKGDKIVAQGKNLEEQAKIMIELAIAKGWDLRKVKVSGSKEFREIANRLIQEKLQELKKEEISLKNALAFVKKETQPSSYTQSKLREAKDNQNYKELNLKTLKEALTVEELLKAFKNKGLLAKDYEIIDNRIKTGKKKLNIVDFCLKEMNLSFKETSKLLNDIYNANLEEFKNKEENMQIDWKQIKRELHPFTIAKYYKIDIKPEQISKKNDEYRIKVNNRNYNVVDYLLKEKGMSFKDITSNLNNLMKLQQQIKIDELNKKIKIDERAKQIKEREKQKKYAKIIENAKYEDLSIFLIELGFSKDDKKSSRKYRVMRKRNNDEMIIVYKKNDKYFYFNPKNSADKGDLYNFFYNRGIKSYEKIAEIVKGASRDVALKQLANADEKNIKKETEAIETWERVFKNRKDNDYSYLTKNRMLDEYIVRVYSNIKSDNNGNIVVPFYLTEDKNNLYLKGFERRLKIRTKDKAKSYINGATRGIVVLQPKNIKNIENIVITEGWIDGLAYIELNNLDPNKTAIVSTLGTLNENIIKSVKKYLQTLNKYANVENITIASDNDDAGRNTAKRILGKLKDYDIKIEFAKNKDFNEDLKEFKLLKEKENFEYIKNNFIAFKDNKVLKDFFFKEIDKFFLQNNITDENERLSYYTDENYQEWLAKFFKIEELERFVKEFENEKLKEVGLDDLKGIEKVADIEIVKEKEQKQSYDNDYGLDL